MKSKVRSLSILFMLIFLTTVVDAQWVTDTEYGFKIKVPNAWSKDKTQDGTDRVHDFLDPTENVFVEVRAFETGEGFTPDILAQVFESSGLPGAQRLAFEDYTLNGTSGKFAGYKTTINGLTVGIGAFYAVTRDYSYILWSLIPIEVYNQYSAKGDAVLNTFTLIPKVNKPRYVAKQEPQIELIAFKISDRITDDYDITVEKKRFPVATPNIWVVYDWKGNGNGSTFVVDWYYEGQYIRGASKEFKMPDFQDGYGYANIDMDGAFKVGKYTVEAKVDSKVLGTISFEVFADQSNTFQIKPPENSRNSASATVWGKANSSYSVSAPQRASSSKVKTVKLGGSKNYYNFKKGIVKSYDDADLLNEPWCTEFPALCGNWVKTGKSQLNQVNSAPALGYISDGKGFTDCQQVPVNEVLVFKLKDGTYAKVLIIKDQFSKTNNRCNHDITLQIIYPAF
ncbi:MAG: hypothetical protein J7K39_11305 [Bacteroidales bacterium]|nr:hypothetical protein [Bacteroidales bacterium]